MLGKVQQSGCIALRAFAIGKRALFGPLRSIATSLVRIGELNAIRAFIGGLALPSSTTKSKQTCFEACAREIEPADQVALSSIAGELWNQWLNHDAHCLFCCRAPLPCSSRASLLML